MGFAALEIAQSVDCAHATIDKRLDRAVGQYGLEATHPTVEENCGDLKEITPGYFESLSDSYLDRYREAAAKHSEHVPDELTSERWDGEWWVIPDCPRKMHRSTYAELVMRMMKPRGEKEVAYFRELRKMRARAQR